MHRQLRRPHRAYPPRAQAKHDYLAVHERSSDADSASQDRQHQRFGDQERPQLRDREAGGAKYSDLPQALLDPEPEEQEHEDDRRGNEKEAEVREVFTEICRAVRCGQCFLPNLSDRHTRCLQSQEWPQRCLKTIRCLRSVSALRQCEPYGGRRAEPRAPQLLSTCEINEGFGCCSILFPVRLVLWSHSREVHRKRRIPVGETYRSGNARVRWRKMTIGSEPFDWNGSRQRELGRVSGETRCRVP